MNDEERANFDWALAAKARRGSATAFVRIARRWWAPVYRFAWNMSGSTSFALEVTESTVLAGIRSSQPRSRPSFEVYLYRLALVWTVMRRDARGPNRQVPSDSPIREALARLDPLDRAALILREIERLPAEEVATILETTAADVCTRTHRALVSLTRWSLESAGSETPPLTG